MTLPLRPILIRPILIRSLDDALTAAAAAATLNRPLALMAGGTGGALWLLGVLERVRDRHPGLEVTALLDCGDRGGEAQGALAAGVTGLLFTGSATAAARLADLARAVTGGRAILLTRCPPLLDLAGGDGNHRRDDREALCRAWLSLPQG